VADLSCAPHAAVAGTSIAAASSSPDPCVAGRQQGPHPVSLLQEKGALVCWRCSWEAARMADLSCALHAAVAGTSIAAASSSPDPCVAGIASSRLLQDRDVLVCWRCSWEAAKTG
jgi:hypothetical protein